ncbi:HU family DNA-binding protein [Demequina sp. NBRC 110054]|uniref:HU family DNA-binding protein n=1 Tax=Demequina sp. NBRC 110054 TaxID=1570343 RepID=UPI000A0660EA|nr:HU family DNA-binding protein [Demequina sp. NBRC 110054]
MNKNELIERIGERAELSKDAVAAVLAGFEAEAAEALGRGDDVRLPGFLTIETAQRSARTGRNPQTGAAIEIPAQTVAKVSAGSKLKAAARGA